MVKESAANMPAKIRGRNEPFRFSGKAGTLATLAPMVRIARLCDQMVVPVGRWHSDRNVVSDEITDRFAPARLAVRSSSSGEDTWHNSNAGAFLSLTNIEPTPQKLSEAIDRVVESYGQDGGDQEVLVQPMVEDVAISGVVLTRDLDTGGPYYVINYDDLSGKTDTVTGGAISKTVAVHRSNPDALHSPRMKKLIEAVQEIEHLTNCDELDIEFCVTSDVIVYVLQVRPLAARHKWHGVKDGDIDESIEAIRAHLNTLMMPAEGLAGSTTILGEMPDWNPAEMIGTAPRPLALSLYKRLITDEAWAEARARMGYRHVRYPLLLDFVGRPYIDVRLSLNSFLPDGLDDSLAERLVNHQLARLHENPQHHDKIEFEIAITCRDFSFSERAKELRNADFSKDDMAALENAYGDLTAKALAGGSGNLRTLLALTDRFLDRAPATVSDDPLTSVRMLLDETVTHGIIPFSVLARHAFIGVSFLRSLSDLGILESADVDAFMNSISTVAGDLVRDMGAVSLGLMDRNAFLARYGHLRPGTYDILSWRYDEKPDLYFGGGMAINAAAETKTNSFTMSKSQEVEIEALLKTAGYAMSAEALMDYIATAIAARENAKFAFTRGISDCLLALGDWGEQRGLSRDDLSFLTIETILSHGNSPNVLHDQAERGRTRHRLTRSIRLPHLIGEPDDIDVIRLNQGKPTFVTSKSVTARTRLLVSHHESGIDGRLVLIESADPGFDWIFSHPIVGLATKYGGVNSHMAIRCAEFGLPAAIGCGDQLFNKLLNASVVELNCADHKITAH